MKTILAAAIPRKTLCVFAVLAGVGALPREAEAIGCISGGLAGGVAGHVAGHGVLGAVGGCVAGHYANKYQKRRAEDAAQPQPGGPGPAAGRSGIQDPTTGFPR